jgi:hypothetical protein
LDAALIAAEEHGRGLTRGSRTMPIHKDFKRLVRARMRKTGEAYTAARAQLVRQRPDPISRDTPAVPADPAGYAVAAGMSDEALKARTGCTWKRWVDALDAVKAYTWPHRTIAEYVQEKYHVPDWWTQTVTVGYERIKGLRDRGQRRGGRYEATKSRTFAVPRGRLYRAFADKRTRARWLDGADLAIRTATRNRSMRITWDDGTSVALWFTSKDRSRSQVQVQCAGLPDKNVVADKKRYWEERLAALEQLIGSPRTAG